MQKLAYQQPGLLVKPGLTCWAGPFAELHVSHVAALIVVVLSDETAPAALPFVLLLLQPSSWYGEVLCGYCTYLRCYKAAGQA